MPEAAWCAEVSVRIHWLLVLLSRRLRRLEYDTGHTRSTMTQPQNNLTAGIQENIDSNPAVDEFRKRRSVLNLACAHEYLVSIIRLSDRF
ncbi:hypothetical protein CEXT_137451 [Caerostris extrusa]|uniref:Uncharacterized protein n=1 Tax=Caerostris extrusa TaxID=172846 RepID=A0AAV4TCE3_CAEEX|nr:hypothetical protein CEXT_137451 [Caerostris extrusa]